MASYYKSMSIFVTLVCSISFVQSINNGDGFTVDLIHRDSPLSPSYNPSQTHFERQQIAFQRSFSRKSSLIEAPVAPNGGEYLMKIQIGTPPVEQLGIADTGSDLTWTQCKPCTECYKQTTPLFDPTQTTSYTTIPCDTQQCSATGKPLCDVTNTCRYQVSYGDKSYSIGQLASETFTFGSNVSFANVVFGCGFKNAGTFSQTGSGIVGLGGGSVSIINQLEKSIGGKFSYCLTLLDSNVTSKISFGSDAVVAGPNVVSTPLVKKYPDTFYYLTLEGVSIGIERFDYKSSSTNTVEEGNIIIDSGTTLTFVPSDLYEEFESGLEKVINGTRGTDSQGTFGLCYEVASGVDFRSPPITMHFRGGDVVLQPVNTFVEVEKGLVCLTILPSQDLAIFGNLNQMNFQIGYDLVNQQVNFLPTDCTKSE